MKALKTNLIKLIPLIVLYTIVFGFWFSYKPPDVYAAQNNICKCQIQAGGEMIFAKDLLPPRNVSEPPNAAERKQCDQDCLNAGFNGGGYLSFFKDSEYAPQNFVPAVKGQIVDFVTGPLGTVFKGLLIVILNFIGILIEVATTLFKYIVTADNIESVLNNPGVYAGWKIVRDFLNIAFILVLLFSAFATVFQVEKYNYKKILLNLVIMALLVNFSFPITRAIIDASNILMFTLIKNLVGGANGLGMITDSTGIKNIIHPPGDISGMLTVYLLAAIIFSFILAITLLAVSLLLVIRIIALAILIIFSPLAFVGSIISTGEGYSNKWWSNLFNYAFFGPIMILVISITVKIMGHMSQQTPIDMKKLAGSESVDPNIVGSIAYFSIPIVILWLGMGIAKQMGVAGSDAVMGRAQKMSKWAGKKFSGAGAAQRTYKAYQSRRQEAQKSSWTNKLGTWAGSKQDQARSYIPLPGKRDAAIRYQRDQAAKIKEETDRNDMTNMDTTDLKVLAASGNKFRQTAAKLELANRRQSAGESSQADLDSVRNTFGETSQIFRQLNAKVRVFDPVAAFSHISGTPEKDEERRKKLTEFVNSSQFDAKKLSAHSFEGDSGGEFLRIALQEEAIFNSDLEDLRKKSIEHERNITSSLEAVASGFTEHMTTSTEDIENDPSLTEEQRQNKLQQQKINRNVQLAHFAQTGKVHSSMEPILASSVEAQQQIFSKMNSDNMKRIKKDTVTRYYQQIADNINIGTYKTALPVIENRTSQGVLNHHILESLPADHPLRIAVEGDPRLKNINIAP